MNAHDTAAMIRCVNACRRAHGDLARTVEGDSQAIASALVLAALSVLASVGNAIGASPEALLTVAGEKLPELYAREARCRAGRSVIVIDEEMKKRMGDCGEAGLRALDEVLDSIVEAHGFDGVPANQMKFVIAIHLLGTVAQRSRLTKSYALAQVAEKLPRAMDASEGDEHIDIHRGGVPS